MTTGKTIALTRQIFVGKIMSLLSNMLSRLVITFLPRSKCLLISWLQSPSAVILEPPKIKSMHDFCAQSCLNLCDPTRLLCLSNFSGKNTGIGCHFRLWGIFMTQGLNLHFLCLLCLSNWQVDSFPLRHQENPHTTLGLSQKAKIYTLKQDKFLYSSS